ncbi:MAG: hypothetical protein AB1779_02855 [Candidatus Thermoplasmatota archaeon]
MKAKKISVVAICTIILFSAIAAIGSVSGTTGEKPKVIEEKGTTDMFGGGDYVALKVGEDAFFGVMYGTEKNPNSIIILSILSRYVGVVKAYDENGALIGSKLIKIYTIYAVKLEDFFEFNDTNGDGVCNYKRTGYGLRYKDYYAHEPIYKKVSLTTSWERSKVEIKTTNNTKSWEFSLTARNLSYIPIGDSDTIRESVKNDRLEKVQFNFYLRAELVEVSGVKVPVWKVTITKGDEANKTVKLEPKIYNGTSIRYAVKVDHIIEGWDFDPTNSNKYLLLEAHAIVGNAMPLGLAKWINENLIKNVKQGGNVKYTTEDGKEETMSEDDAADPNATTGEKPRKIGLKHPRLDLIDEWQRIGRLTWITNVTVDGVEKTMSFQVQGHRGFVERIGNRGLFIGFVILGGFAYPGGSSIVHDPEVGAETNIGLTEVGKAPAIKPKLPIIGIAIGVIVVGAAVGGFIVYMTKKKGGKEFEGSYDMGTTPKNTKPEYEIYEDKK